MTYILILFKILSICFLVILTKQINSLSSGNFTSWNSIKSIRKKVKIIYIILASTLVFSYIVPSSNFFNSISLKKESVFIGSWTCEGQYFLLITDDRKCFINEKEADIYFGNNAAIIDNIFEFKKNNTNNLSLFSLEKNISYNCIRQ